MTWKGLLQWVAIFSIMTLLRTTALAQEPGFYISGAAGMAMPSYNKIFNRNNNTSINSFFSSGFSFKNNLRTELEVSYWDHTSGTSVSLMSNIFYEFYNSSNFVPYIGTGIGRLWSTSSDRVSAFSNSTFKRLQIKHPYQGIIGFKYKITEKINSFVDYRYSNIQTSRMFNNKLTRQKGIHGVIMGLRWSFRMKKNKEI